MTDSFKLSADRATERGDKKIAKRIMMERRVCFALVDALLAAGCTVSHDNGEDEEVTKSTDKQAIRNAFFATDMESVAAYQGDGCVAWFSLIYGNDGYDVISDHSDNEFSNAVMEKVQPVIDKLELAAY